MSLFAASATAALIGAMVLLLVNAYYGTNQGNGVAAAVIFFGVACGIGGRLLLAMCATHVRNESRGAVDATAMVVGCALGYVLLILLLRWPAVARMWWVALLLPIGTTAAASYVRWQGSGLHVFYAVGALGALVTLYGSMVG